MTHLKFDSKFDCLVCLNAEIPPLGFFIKYFPDIPIVGADGGAVRLFEKGIIADYVVGDLDTFSNARIEKHFKNSEIIFNPDQEINDFEKALIFVEQKGFRNILVLGFQGGELDHTLNNWSILIKYFKCLNLCLFDKGNYGIPLNESFKIETQRNELMSLIPQPKARLKTQNLRWNLESEVLELGFREGARNITTGEEVTIEILEGAVLLFLRARLPYCYRKEKALWTR